jgi:hypothetical protein
MTPEGGSGLASGCKCPTDASDVPFARSTPLARDEPAPSLPHRSTSWHHPCLRRYAQAVPPRKQEKCQDPDGSWHDSCYIPAGSACASPSPVFAAALVAAAAFA